MGEGADERVPDEGEDECEDHDRIEIVEKTEERGGAAPEDHAAPGEVLDPASEFLELGGARGLRDQGGR